MSSVTAQKPGWRRWVHGRLPRLLPGGRPETLPTTLHRHRIYILPTRYGLFFGVLLFVMLLGSLNYNNNLALMLTFLLGGMMLIAPAHTYRNLARVRVESCRGAPVFAGGTAVFHLLLSNPGSAVRCAIRAQTDTDADRVNLPPNGEAAFELEHPATRRGWLAAPRVRVFTEYPLGLFHAWSWLDAPGRILVFPAPDRRAGPLPYAGRAGTSGRYQRHDDDEFAGLRDYQSGDPSRLIAWKVLARTDELQSKTFQTPRQSSIWLEFHQTAGDTERRLSRLTHWVLEAERQSLRYGLRLPGRTIEPGTGARHRYRCLKALALCETA